MPAGYPGDGKRGHHPRGRSRVQRERFGSANFSSPPVHHGPAPRGFGAAGKNRPSRAASEERIIALGGGKSVMCTATISSTFPSRKSSEMNWWPAGGLCPTISFPKAAG